MGDVYGITQGTGTYAINESLAQNLTRQPWAELVSPEVLGVGVLNGTPIVLRGADASVFVRMEGAEWVQGGASGYGWVVAGAGLRDRARLALGGYITLAGSTIPRLAVAPLTGVYRSGTAANDELVVEESLARFLTGVQAGIYHSIRVKTADAAALFAFLSSYGSSVHVTGPGGILGSVNSEPPSDPRLINLFLRYGQGPLPLDYLAEGLNEATASVRVASLGLVLLLGLLVAFGVHAVQGRVFADRRSSVGILRAVGAGGSWMEKRLLAEILPMALAAGVVGLGLGWLVTLILSPLPSVLAFGHEVRVPFDVATFLGSIGFLVAVSALSASLLLRSALRERPTESIRDEAAVEPPPSLEVVLRG